MSYRYATDLEYRKHILELNKQSYQKYKEKRLKAMKEYRIKNKDTLSIYNKERWKNNPYEREYNKSERGRERDKRHKKTEKGILSNKKQCKKYYEKHKEQMHEYNICRRPNKEINLDRARKWAKTEYGKQCRRKIATVRDRRLGFNILFENQLDEQFVWHHVNEVDVVAVPRDLHELFGRGKYVDVHRDYLVPIVVQLYPSITGVQ